MSPETSTRQYSDNETVRFLCVVIGSKNKGRQRAGLSQTHKRGRLDLDNCGGCGELLMAISCSVSDTGGWLLQERPSGSRLFTPEKLSECPSGLPSTTSGFASKKCWQDEKRNVHRLYEESPIERRNRESE